MKVIKKIKSLMLVMFMALATMVSVYAADTYTITINNDKTGHTYEAYQIFKGDLSADGKKLSNIVWGSGVTDEGKTALGDATSKANSLTTVENAEAFAKSVAEYLQNPKKSNYDNGKYVIDGLEPGYYLVKDEDSSLTGKDDAYTSYILKVVNNVTTSPKSAKPTVDKEVQDETTDAENGAVNGWGETADHAINESFKFKLTAILPADTNFNAYETYKLVFHDTMSEGLTFESIESVKVNGNSINGYVLSENAVNDAKGELEWTLTINDLKSIDGVELKNGATVEVIYNAHLNEEAKVGNLDDNKNTVKLEYSNNPNVSGTGNHETGKTEEDTVWVFTYRMDNTKVDGTNNNEPLGGAGFRLYDSTGTNEIKLIYDESLGGYRPVKDSEQGVEMFSADDTGIFNIIGLDAGTYVLKETTTPDGYNTCDDITVVISATHNENTEGTSASTDILMNGQSSTGNQIVNNQGTTLPETGGIGTTIFYVVGGAMMVGAAVLFITKKRIEE